MIVLICGDRAWNNPMRIYDVLLELHSRGAVDSVVHGACKGADLMGASAALRMCLDVRPFPAQWQTHGNAAGPIRNQQMLDEGRPTLVLAFHNNIHLSKGTKDMVKRSFKAGVETWLYTEHRHMKFTSTNIDEVLRSGFGI